jgi:hypothetical protein
MFEPIAYRIQVLNVISTSTRAVKLSWELQELEWASSRCLQVWFYLLGGSFGLCWPRVYMSDYDWAKSEHEYKKLRSLYRFIIHSWHQFCLIQYISDMHCWMFHEQQQRFKSEATEQELHSHLQSFCATGESSLATSWQSVQSHEESCESLFKGQTVSDFRFPTYSVIRRFCLAYVISCISCTTLK